MKRDSKVTRDPQMVAYECKSCGEIVQGPTGYVNYCGICGKKLKHEMVTATGKHPIPKELASQFNPLDPKDLDPNRRYSVSKVSEIRVDSQGT